MTIKETLKSVQVKPTRELFIGPAGCGKSEKLLQIFEERLKLENPLEPQSYFIVPSREHAERIIKKLIIRGLPGFFAERVTTLDDLIEQSFEVPNPPAISNLTKIAVARQLLNDDCGQYFEKVRGQPGFLNLILNFLSELKDFCWTPAAFRIEMNRLKKLEPDAATKYEALAGIYERYEAALQQLGLRDRRDTLALYRARKAATLRPLHFHTLCLDGFFDFTPVQAEALQELAVTSDNFYAALTWDAAHASFFEPVTATKKMFEVFGFQIKVLGKDLPRFKNADLQQVSFNLFNDQRDQSKLKKASDEGIDWFEAPDVEAEVEMIARRILGWTSQKKIRPSDIAVLLRSVRPHRSIFETVFRRFKIPVEIHERERLSDSEWIQTTSRLVRFFREGWKKEDWMGFVRSSFVTKLAENPKDERRLHLFESYLKKKGVREGVKSWEEVFVGQELEKSESLEWAPEWFHTFSEIERGWRETKTVVEWTLYFKRMVFKNFGMLVCFNSSSEPLGGFEKEAAAPARFEKILDEMERASARGPEPNATFDRFADDFLRLVELDLFSLPELNQNAVQIYDVSLARQKEYEVVFVAGMAEKQFPLQVREDALFSDWERRLISKKSLGPSQDGPYGLPERKARQQLEKYLFYMAVTRARQHVCVSHARRDEEGKPILPSFYLEELAACFAGGISKTIKKDTQPYPHFSEVLTPSDLLKASVGALFNPWEKPQMGDSTLKLLLEQALTGEDAQVHLSKALALDDARLADEKILAHEAFHPKAPSPTRLEAYAKCSYRYFSERILKLQETEEDTCARNQGIVMHGVLEDFFKGPWKEIHESKLGEWVDQSIEKWIAESPLDLGPYQAALARLEIKNILMRFLKFEIERLSESAFQPRHFEFEIPKEKPVKLNLKEGSVFLQGKIDRIDLDSENKHFVISDYKRARNFDKKSIENGTSLQLPLYLLAVQKLLGLKPAGGQLLNMKDLKKTGFYSEVVVEARSKLSSEEFDRVLSRALHYSAHYLKELATGKIAVEPRDCLEGCGYAALCRIEKWKLPEIAEKIRAEDKKLGF